MKKVLFLLIFLPIQVYAQSTWLKLVPGFWSQTTFFNEDTILSVGSAYIGSAIFVTVNYSNLRTGKLYNTDSVDYFEISKDLFTTNEYRRIDQSVYNKSIGELTLGFNYADTLKGKYKWQSAIFSINPLKKLPYQLNHDTFNTKLEGYQKIGKNYYAMVWWENRLNEKIAKPCYQLFKLNPDFSTTLLKQQINSRSCVGCHSVDFGRLIGDNQNPGNLFLETTDEWDFQGGPASWQTDIYKLDSTGKTLWKCRPNERDSFNPTGFQMIQKPNGNILCSWNDFYHPPHKHPSIDYYAQLLNYKSTIWFAEIDYQSGKVLWRKGLRNYLSSQFTAPRFDSINKTFQAVFFNDVKLVNNTSIVWGGYREKSFPMPTMSKKLAVLLKTDLDGTPVWYREHEIFPEDSCDKGMRVLSVTQTPDGGFLLAGGHENIPPQNANCEYWQKGALLKLDSFGCWKLGCQLVGVFNKLPNETKLCKIFPNPGSSNISIQIPKNSLYNLKIYASDGKLVEDFNMESDYSFNTLSLNAGMYLFILKNSKTLNLEVHKVTIVR